MIADGDKKEDQSFGQASPEVNTPIYTMPDKFLPSALKKSGKSGRGLIIFLYILIALVIIAGGAAIWYFFVYNNGSAGIATTAVSDVTSTIGDNQADKPAPESQPDQEDLPGVEVKFVAKDQDTKQEVSSLLVKLSGVDADLADLIQVASLLPTQATGRARQAVGAIYTISSGNSDLRFSEPTPFIFSYIEPDDLTTKKENSLRLWQELPDGSWIEIDGATLNIITNEVMINWQSLPTGRIAILSNLEENIQEVNLEEAPADNLLDSINPLVISIDSDNDLLSDQEELLFGADKNMPDSDSDGYLDGSEVINGYSPVSTSTLLADGLTAEYQDAELGFKVNYPSTWLVVLPKEVGEQKVIFESPQDDFIQVSVQDKIPELSALEWYTDLVPEVVVADLKIDKVGDYTGVTSPDNGNFYLAVGDKIYIFTYSTGLKTEVDYLTVFKMIYKSFRFTVGDES